jgi:hypothetical protein
MTPPRYGRYIIGMSGQGNGVKKIMRQ